MKNVSLVICSLLTLVITSCNYDTENSKAPAVSPDEYVKTVANEFFTPTNLDTTELMQINRTITFLAKSYAGYPSSVTGRPSIGLLIQDIKDILGGHIQTLTTVVDGFKNEQGVYEANTDSAKWIRTGNANDSIVMYFKDQNNQERQAIMAWYNTLGQPLRMTFVRDSGTVTVDLPSRIMIKLLNLSAANDSALTITLNVIPDQAFTQVNLSTSMTYLNYSLNTSVLVKDTAMHVSAVLAKNDRQLASYRLDGDGYYMLHGFFDKVDYTLTWGSYNSKLNILDKLYTTNNVKDANTLKNYILSNSSTGTYEYIKGICEIVNKNMYFRVWNASGSLLCSATMYPVKLNGAYTGAPYVNWIYGDSQDLSDFSSPAIKTTVSRLQQILKYFNNLLGTNS